MIILGIDPGTRVAGYGIINKQSHNLFTLIDYGCIRPPTKMKLTDRYHVIFQAIQELIDRYQPEVLAIETQYVRHNPQSAIKLGMARGVIIAASKDLGIPIFEYTPSKVKLAIVGNGKASKEQVQGMVKYLLQLPSLPEPHDAADALALAICHAHALNLRPELTSEI